MAKQAGIEDLHIQSMNYNLNPNQHNDGYGGKSIVNFYNISGSVNIQLNDEAKAIQLSEFLAKKDIITSVNMNSYKQGNCRNH